MKKIGLNLVSRILIYIRATSFSIVILWMVFEIELIQNYGHTKQLQDWIFTLFFCIFFISATGLIILRLFDETKIKKDIARRIITFCLIFTFITSHRFDLTMKDYYYGQKIYANQHVYLKVYSAWFRAAEYYLYKTDSILFIKEGEWVNIWDVDEYIDFLKDKYK